MTQDNSQDSLSAALKPAAPVRTGSHFQPALPISLLALLISLGFGFYQYQQAENLKEDIKANLVVDQQSQSELKNLQLGAATRQQQLEARFTLIEARQAEARNQQEALAGMYGLLTRNDTTRNLAEIEQTLTFASQQLQLTGNVTATLGTLVSVDQKLAQMNRPELISVRQALAKDMDSLKALPAFDLSGTSIKLDNLASNIDKLPLTIDGLRDPAAAKPKVEGDRLTRFAVEVWHDMKQLIQIRRMDRPDAMLLSPEQAFFVRENLKLRLMNARTALLLRDETAYREDMKAVVGYLRQYFDMRATQAINADNLVQQLATQPLALKLPDLAGSLAATRNARSVAERAKP